MSSWPTNEKIDARECARLEKQMESGEEVVPAGQWYISETGYVRVCGIGPVFAGRAGSTDVLLHYNLETFTSNCQMCKRRNVTRTADEVVLRRRYESSLGRRMYWLATREYKAYCKECREACKT